MAALQDSGLGKTSVYPQKYDNTVLFRIPREENRKKYGIDTGNLPFTGLDVWNAYEISFLTDNGLPVSRVMKMTYSASAPYLVESKSLKLYLNSFNMEKSGKTQEEACENVRERISEDLGALLETPVSVTFFKDENQELQAFSDMATKKLTDLAPAEALASATFSHFLESPELLSGKQTDSIHRYEFSSDLLRSNCPVTNQPDWGDLFVRMQTTFEIDFVSIAAYLISFRKENHFHEEVVEMIFKRFMDAFSPSEMMVAAMYTRRGGIDINPIRMTHSHLMEKAFEDTSVRLGKTLRQ